LKIVKEMLNISFVAQPISRTGMIQEILGELVQLN
jgi:hypothetical protein